MTQLYLIRHGESEANHQRVFAGNYNIDLTELGYRQAAKIPAYFKGIHIDAIFASDLLRAYHTACPLAEERGIDIVKETALREISAGAWEGQKFDWIMETHAADYTVWRNDIGNAVCTGGESVLQVSKRVLSAIEKIAKAYDGKSVVLATHATPIRSMISLWETGSLAGMQAYKWVPNASVTSVTYDEGKFTVREIGCTEHLLDLLTELPPNV